MRPAAVSNTTASQVSRRASPSSTVSRSSTVTTRPGDEHAVDVELVAAERADRLGQELRVRLAARGTRRGTGPCARRRARASPATASQSCAARPGEVALHDVAGERGGEDRAGARRRAGRRRSRRGPRRSSSSRCARSRACSVSGSSRATTSASCVSRNTRQSASSSACTSGSCASPSLRTIACTRPTRRGVVARGRRARSPSSRACCSWSDLRQRR